MTLNRRSFLVLLGASVGTYTLNTRRSPGWISAASADEVPKGSAKPFAVPPLPYPYDALEPHIDARTMRFHHDKHHAAYVSKLNAALEKHPKLKGQTAEQLLRGINTVPEDIRQIVRDNGGGHVNHTMFWSIMSPNAGGEPTGAIASAIKQTFGSFAEFKKQFNSAGEKRFGSGWVWLVLTKNGKLQIISTANQDSPLIEGNYPLMGNDVWEHAYYLNYQNRRADYLTAWWNVVNWNEINKRFEQATKAV